MGFLSNLRSWLDQPIIPGGVVAPCVEAIKGIGEITGSMCAGVVGLAQGGAAFVAAAANMVSFGGGERDASEPAQRVTAQAPQQEMAATAPTCKYHVSMSELGCMAPQTFGEASRSSGVGVSV